MTDQAIELFDHWVANGEAEAMSESHAVAFREAVKNMDVQPGERVLDIGCGTGWATRALAHMTGAPAVGVDGSEKMVATARRLSVDGPACQFVVARFEALPFDAGAFDRVFSMEALYYADDLPGAFREFMRVLHDGGRFDLLINFFVENAPTARWPGLLGLDKMHNLDAEGWADLARDAGFIHVETDRIVHPDGPGDRADFQPSDWAPDWVDWVAFKQAGTLWVSGWKP